MLFDADCEGTPKTGKDNDEQELIDKKVESIWETATYCHFNRDFRFNSQSTSMQFTPYKTIGGRAWTSIALPTMQHEKALVLWSNTTFGIMLYWWLANKQQDGRGSIGKSALAEPKTFDVKSLSKEDLKVAAEVFDEFSERELLPANEIDRDKTRAELDGAFVRRVLKIKNWQVVLKNLDLVRRKLAAEPSIAGHKVEKTTPTTGQGIAVTSVEPERLRTPQAEFLF